MLHDIKKEKFEHMTLSYIYLYIHQKKKDTYYINLLLISYYSNLGKLTQGGGEEEGGTGVNE